MTNTKNTKRALITSVVALFLCFTMLLGSTFAWFTDSAASGSNVIKSGNLDIKVEYTLDGENWDDLDGANDLFQKGLWEPGHTEVVALRIKNNGSLALKYSANMNIVKETVGKTKDGKYIVLSDILAVSTMAQQADNIGDIALMLAFRGENAYYETTTSFKAANVLRSGKDLAPGAAHYLIIKVDMDETIGNEANHNGTDIPEIEFGINIFATQHTSESDSFGNTYDKDASIATVTDMNEALANGATDLDFMGSTVNLNYGFTTAMIPEGTTVTIRNAFVNGRSYGNDVDGTIIFENCTFTNSGAYSIHFDGGKGDVIFKNCTLYGWNSFGSTLNSVNFYDSTLKGNGTYALIRSYVDMRLENCVIDTTNAIQDDQWPEGLETVEGGVLTMVNCTKVNTPANNDSFESAVKDTDATEIVVNLTDDVTYDVAAWTNDAMGGKVTKAIVINGNGNTITFNQTNSDWNNIVTNGAKLIINDAHLTNSGHNDGPWNRHDLNFACAVELNNVTSDKAMAFKADATLKNVTINDANTSDTYAIWIQPNGQTIDIDGLTIDMLAAADGRGIKIDNEYVTSSEKAVTLNVKNATFKTEEKSAILVKSTKGATINVGENVDISEVAADPLHAVWVDEDAEAYYDLVTVTGGEKILEGTVAFPNNGTDLTAALKDGKDVYLGADVAIADTASRLTMNGGSLDGNGKTITYSGDKLTNMSAPVLTTNGGSISNLTVEASNNGRALYVTTLTKDLYVADCVLSGAYSFNLNSNYVTDYTINFSKTVFKNWVSYANVVKAANFEKCVFEGNLRAYGETVLTDCQFTSTGTLDLVELVSGETIALTGCTKNGSALTVDMIKDMQSGADIANYTITENAGVITITRK